MPLRSVQNFPSNVYVCLLLFSSLLVFSGQATAEDNWETVCAIPVFKISGLTDKYIGPSDTEQLKQIYSEHPADNPFRIDGTKYQDPGAIGEAASDFLRWMKKQKYHRPFLYAKRFSGIKPPYCQENTRTYRLHVLRARDEIKDSAAARYRFDPPQMEVNLSALIADMKSDGSVGFGHTYAQHELAHAILNNYQDSFMEPAASKWIYEGIPEMLAIEWFRAEGSKKPQASQRWFGVRDYTLPLYLTVKGLSSVNLPEEFGGLNTYKSSSFWTYLREKYQDQLIQGYLLQPTPQVCNRTAENENLLECSLAEISVLEEVIKKHEKRGLAYSYPNFLSWHLKRLAKNWNKSDIKDHHKTTFGDCVKIPVHHEASIGSASTTLDISHIAAKCVEFSIPDKGAFFVYATELTGKSGYSALSMGRIDGKHWTKPQMQVVNQQKKIEGAEWKFDVRAGESVKFFISNASRNPGKLAPVKLKLQASMNHWKSNFTREEMDDGSVYVIRGDSEVPSATGLSAKSTFSAHVNRSITEWPCTEPFRFLACGPRMSIDLIMTPSIVDKSTKTDTGTLDTMGDLAAGWTAETAQAHGMNGSEIAISIPLIDYGYVGTFNNALIDVHSANNKHAGYSAKGPRDAIPGPGNGYPLSGSVNIEVYNPWVMRGSFSAKLVKNEPDHPLDDDETLQVVTTIQGRFNIASPWKGDNRYRGVSANDPEYWGANNADGASVTETPAGSRSTRKPISTANETSCDCSCNYTNTTDTDCQQSCSEEFLACKGEQFAPAPVASETDNADTDKFRQKFITELEQLMPGPGMKTFRDSAIKSFDDATTDEARHSIYQVYLGRM